MTDALSLYTAAGFERVERSACAQGCDAVYARSL
jgi:hypothetical protein